MTHLDLGVRFEEVDQKEIQILLAQADTLTKQGKKMAAISIIETLREAKPEPKFLASIARIANRNSAYLLGLRVLFSEIQQDRQEIRKASSESFVVYANSLLNLGALEEAHEMIEKAVGVSEAFLIKAFIYFAKWDYSKALPILQRYIRQKDLTSYQVLVGKVNIAAVYVTEKNYVAAKELLREVIEALQQDPSRKLLLGNCYELLSQTELNGDNLDEASRLLHLATEAMSGFDGRYSLYVKKWLGVLEMQRDPTKVEAILKVRREAQEIRNWETVRDCDFQMARITKNENLLHRIYWGTPYRDFRKRMLESVELKLKPTQIIDYCPQEPLATPQTIVWDIESSITTTHMSKTVATLTQVMTRDFYRPPRMGLVFSSLYKDEKLNPFTSGQRIRNSVDRFNQWALESEIPFKISIHRGDFLFVGDAAHGIRVRVRERLQPLWRLQLQSCKNRLGLRPFSMKMLMKELNVSERLAQDIVQRALSAKDLQKIGRGRETRYKFRGRPKAKQI